MVKEILIVDDQSNIRQLLDLSLRKKGRKIFLAASGEEALEIAREKRFDLVIMDLMMPGGMDGFEAIGRLRKEAQMTDCSVLILTAKDQPAERKRAAELKVDDYLTKPFRLEDLFCRVEELLGSE